MLAGYCHDIGDVISRKGFKREVKNLIEKLERDHKEYVCLDLQDAYLRIRIALDGGERISAIHKLDYSQSEITDGRIVSIEIVPLSFVFSEKVKNVRDQHVKSIQRKGAQNEEF